jgi:FkbM family methyltransferase
MIKKVVRTFLEALGVEVAFKKNLWYLDAYEVQKKMVKKSNPVIFDVGASDGSVVKKYKDIYPGAQIHAFEPQPDSFATLSQLASQLKDVHCNNIALSDVKGINTFYKTNSYPSSSLLPSIRSGSFVDQHTVLAEKYDVTLNTLNDYAESHNIEYIDILKMDVQGNELNILKGGDDLLKKGRIDIIYSEVWFTAAYENQPFYEDIALYLRSFGYLPFGLYNMHYDFKLKGKNLWADAIFLKNPTNS